MKARPVTVDLLTRMARRADWPASYFQAAGHLGFLLARENGGADRRVNKTIAVSAAREFIRTTAQDMSEFVGVLRQAQIPDPEDMANVAIDFMLRVLEGEPGDECLEAMYSRLKANPEVVGRKMPPGFARAYGLVTLTHDKEFRFLS